ncbi:YidB family protein [Ottowia thiooxydans]|uniref:YidB family protein n=1 Tax=Ottowia thiooxydans TaxID=219182 RepID=UPI0004139359|nr:YidB family protein [Ottowia thiooxydans]
MFEILIREAATRFGVGDKALPLLQMLLAYMTAKETGGLVGFLEKFKAAGLGPIVQSWLGGGPAAQPVSNSQLETVVGASGGLLSLLTSKLGVDRENVASAVGYLLPAVVGKLTPGGSIPSSLPPEIASLAAAGQTLLAVPVVASSSAAAGGGGAMKWLPWIIVAIAALFGLNYCSKSRTAEPVPAVAPASAPSSGASGPVGSFGPGPAMAPASAPSTGASVPGGDVQASAEPAGSGILAWLSSEAPALKVYFESGKTEVSNELGAKATELVNYLKEHADAKAVISGFNDPTGDAAKNAELSKQRAEAVQAALVAAGVPQDRTVLEKPAEPTGTGATNSASRRVEVVVRK